MDEIKNYISLDNIASFSSILSLIISFFVLLSVRKIRQFYILQARVPEITQKLSELASELSGSLDSFSGTTTRIQKTLVDIEISLKSLKRKVPRDIQKNINLIINEIQKSDPDSKSIMKLFKRHNSTLGDVEAQRDFLEKLHLSTYKIISQCNNIQLESRWER